MRDGVVSDPEDAVDPSSTAAMPGHATAQQQRRVTQQHLTRRPRDTQTGSSCISCNNEMHNVCCEAVQAVAVASIINIGRTQY